VSQNVFNFPAPKGAKAFSLGAGAVCQPQVDGSKTILKSLRGGGSLGAER